MHWTLLALSQSVALPALRVYTQGYHLFVAGQRSQALPLLEQAVSLDTGFAIAWALSNMALAYRDWRRVAAAESLYRQAIQADSTIAVIWYGLHSALAREGKFAESRHTLDEIARRFPGDRVLTIVEVQDAAARQDWEEAERRAEANIAANQSDTLQLVDAFEQMAGIVETQGRLAEAERYWRTQLRLSAASHSRGRHVYGVSELALIELRYHGQPARARALMDSALASTPLDSILPGDRPYYELARFYASVGDLPRAHGHSWRAPTRTTASSPLQGRRSRAGRAA